MNNSQKNILIVDDEEEIADLLEVYLKNEGYQVFKYYSGQGVLECIEHEDIHLALLDVMLPDTDGFSLCRKIREKWFFPIIMLTAKVEETDKIMGITLGADDYITKPFHPLELVARVKSALRRFTKYNSYQEHEQSILINGLEIDPLKHQCLLYDQRIDLTPKEFEILLYLAKHQGQVVSSEELFLKVWKEKYLDSNNTIMVHIRRIREKLNDNTKNPKFIKTVWGVGYTIEK